MNCAVTADLNRHLDAIDREDAEAAALVSYAEENFGELLPEAMQDVSESLDTKATDTAYSALVNGDRTAITELIGIIWQALLQKAEPGFKKSIEDAQDDHAHACFEARELYERDAYFDRMDRL